ncbi:hypothetical protein M2336_000155 [Sphingobium sp. B1D7B]|uniref:class I SAM-dependent methyltransferase n=1 Tax=unclassified Sphingobium TaxID=2611147 RepID=UPI002224E207|nr:MULTISPECIES: class I SAM-dependent methyltransferase [unclassified Sphingobium]MCW2391771.1 hypothetical protein [Sphingobium sp. B11D3A]MCW2403526.1 hypothetical protein [Sphingobium sp. B1D7B]
MDDRSKPWLTGDSPARGGKRHAPATVRNRDAIAQLLAQTLPATGLVLEIASGSGEHAVHFARCFPALRWLPSDPDPVARASITAWADEVALPNLAPPLQIDAADPEAWPIGEADAILCINMVHISPWAATLGLLHGAAMLLPEGAPLFLYGPYFRREVETAPSNLAFDESLRARDPAWGLRWVHDVEAAAASEGFELKRVVEMPANNLSLIFRRGPHPG